MNDNPIVQECYQCGGAFWFIIEEDEHGYCFGLVDLIETELGYFYKDEIQEAGAVKNPCWNPRTLSETYDYVSLLHEIMGVA